MIVVAGESLIDLISSDDGLRAVPGGGPFNVARTVARLGRDCSYLGALSSDHFGTQLRAGLTDDGVDDRWAPATRLPTTLAVAQLDDVGAATYTFYVAQTSATDISPAQARAVLAARPRLLCLGTLGLVLEPVATALESLCDAIDHDVIVAVDPNCRPGAVPDHAAYRARLRRVLDRADIVKVSSDDLDYLSPGVDHLVAAEQLRAQDGTVVLVTDGGHDVHIVAGGWRRVVQVPRVPVVDTVGAGDSFLGAVLAVWDARGLARADLADASAVEAAVRFGIGVSAITCGRTGADPPRVAELPAELLRAFEPGT